MLRALGSNPEKRFWDFLKLRFNTPESRSRLPKDHAQNKKPTFIHRIDAEAPFGYLTAEMALPSLTCWKDTPDVDFVPACAEPHGGLFIMLSAVTQLGVTNSCSNWGFSISYCKQELIIYPAAAVVLLLSFIICFFLSFFRMKTQTSILWEMMNRKKKMKKVLYQTKVISRYYAQENFWTEEGWGIYFAQKRRRLS